MRRPRIRDCHAAALELERIARDSSSTSQVEQERREMCQRMAEWLGELGREMGEQVEHCKRRDYTLPRRTPIARVPFKP